VWPNAKVIMLMNFEKFLLLSALKKSTWDNINSISEHCGNFCKEKYDLLRGNKWPKWEIFQENNYNIVKLASKIFIDDDVIKEIQLFYPYCSMPTDIFNIDVDGTYFDKEKFFEQMKDLYRWMGYDDFNSTLLEKYWTPYINLHIDKV
jgi:hypothetical protein